MHRLLLVSSELEGLPDCHYHQGDQESAPESCDHDDNSPHVRIGDQVTEANSGNGHYDDPNGLKVTIKVNHSQLPVVFNFEHS